MGLKDLIERLRGLKRDDDKEIIDDNETRDKHLRSLRRERRMQNEETEKEQLMKDIAEFKKERMKKHLFGIKGEIKKKKMIELKKKVNLMEQSHNLLSDRIEKPKDKEHSFLGKSNL